MASTRCLGRLVDDKKTGFFGNNKNKFHLELRCEKLADDASGLCIRCIQRPRELQKNHPPLLHGVVNGPIPAWSHIFGSAWYESKVAAFGIPSEAEMAKAKKAQADARKGTDTLETPLVVATPVVTEAPAVASEVKPKKRGPKKVDTVVAEPSANTTVLTAPAPVKKKRTVKPKIKIVEEAMTSPIAPTAPVQVPTAAIESTQDPLEGLEVIRIRVKKMEYDGTEYYLDSNKLKLYSLGSDKRPSAYVGRWDPRNEAIDREFPDSDAEA